MTGLLTGFLTTFAPRSLVMRALLGVDRAMAA